MGAMALIDSEKEITRYQAELEKALARRAEMHEKHMSKYRDGTATRATTTTHNANVAWLNERIAFLREQIKSLSS